MNQENTILFLMFHRIIPNTNIIESDYDISFERFKKIAKKIDNSKNEKSNHITIIPTFDDGNKSDLLCAKYLNEYNIKAIFFVIIDKINNEGYLSDKDIIEISNLGHYVGSHTMSHLVCPKSKSDIVLKELIDSKEYLEKLLKKKCDFFAFPGGLFSKRDFLLAQKANFKYIFSTFEKLPGKINIDEPNPRMHIRVSTLGNLNSIIQIDKYYYLFRYIRSVIKDVIDTIKFHTSLNIFKKKL